MTHLFTYIPSRFSGLRAQTSGLAILAALSLAACGGSGGSSSGGTMPVMPPPQTGPSFSIDGKTTKGLILDGFVDVVDAADTANVLVSGRTSATDGTYDLTIPTSANFTGPFVRVTVEGGPGALMICDAGDGCLTPAGSSVAFGDTFAIDNTVSLSAIVPTPAANATDTVNLTIFSDLAASLADSNSGGTLSAADIDEANAQVSDLFGLLTIDPTELEAVDVTDGAASSTDDNSLRAAILSGGVLGAALENGADIGTALDNLRADFVANGGQLVINEDVDDPALISLEDILGESLTVVDESDIDSEEFQQASAEILGDSVNASGTAAGQQTSAGTAPSNSAPPLDQAKAFVSDLQLIVEAVSQDNEDNIVDFAERVEDAALLIEDEAESAVDAALKASEAIALAYEAFQDNNTITTFSANGFVVDVSSSGGDLSLDIASQTVGAETVQMSILGDLDVQFTEVDIFTDNGTSTSGEESTTIIIDNDASLSGSVTNSAVTLAVLGGEVSVAGGEFESSSIFESGFNTFDSTQGGVSSSSSEFTEFVLVTADRVSGSLDVEITENRANGIAFTGVASASLVGPRFESEEAEESISSLNFTGFAFETVSAEIESADISFSGSFSEGGQFVDVSFAFQADGNDLVLTNSGELEDVLPYSVSSNVLTITTERGNETYEFVTQAQAMAELTGGTLGNFSQTNPNGSDVYLNGSSELSAFSNIPDPVAPVLRIQTDLVRQNSGFTNVVFFLQTDTIQDVLTDRSGWTTAFLTNPPTDIIDYYNQGVIIEDTPRTLCLPDATGTNPTLYLFPEPFLTSTGSVIQATPLNENFFNQNGGTEVSRCELPRLAPGFSSFGEVETALSFDPDASATGLIAGSVSQNIAGIDPMDPLVTASFFGPLSFANEEVGGNLTLKLDFAGRTFQTDARSLAVFDDLSEPVTITNQDGVMMVISEDLNSEATGQVTLDGTVHGTITENNGVVIVTYTDNTFVSIQ